MASTGMLTRARNGALRPYRHLTSKLSGVAASEREADEEAEVPLGPTRDTGTVAQTRRGACFE